MIVSTTGTGDSSFFTPHVDVVSVGLRGDELDEWRAHVRVAFVIERVNE